MRIFTQIFFAALTLFGLLSQEYAFASSDSNQFSTYLFGCYECAEEKDSDENHSVIKQDFHQPKIGSGGADEEKLSSSSLASGSSGLVPAFIQISIASCKVADTLKSYQDTWRSTFQQPDLLAFLGSRKLFA